MNLAAEESPTPVFEVGLAPRSSSNLYVDLDDTLRGAFVATYGFGAHAIGSRVVLQLHLPGGVEIGVAGVVEWQRVASDNVAPGCGVRFARALTKDELEKLRCFAGFREPLLYG